MATFTHTQLLIGTLILWALALSAHAQPVSKVMTQQAELKTMPSTTTLVGSIRPNRTSVIGCEVEGLVASLPVREGDYVRKGQLLCQLKDDTLAIELQAAQRRLESLQATVKIAKAELDRWTAEKTRVVALQSQNLSTPKEIYDTEAEYLVAVSRLHESEQLLREQKALVALKESDIVKTKIQAPFNGHIIELHTEIGQWLQRGGPVIEIIDLESVLVRINVPESAIRHVSVGDHARLLIDALSETFDAKVKHVIPQADEHARTFPIDLEVPNQEHTLRSGMFARATIKTGPAQEMVAVPKDAIVEKQGVSRLWIVQQAGPQGTLAMPTPVSLGSEVGSWVAIISGNIQPDMDVVVRGNERLMPFPSPVVVVDEQALVDSQPATVDLDNQAAHPQSATP